MIIAEIKGGFGNQLFSYGCSYALAKDKKDRLILDKNIYDLGYFRPFELDKLKLAYTDILIKDQVPFDQYAHPFRTKWYQTKRAFKIGLSTKRVIEKTEFQYQPELFYYEKNIHLSGYWQNYRYFHKYCKDIQEQFFPKEGFSENVALLIGELKAKNSVCLHIRRGDYNSFKGGKCLSLDYYEKALGLIENLLGKDYQVYVFSDDVPFVKDIFSSQTNFYYISDLLPTSDLEEFYIMSSCRHQIIANSTYSWWAAYLNINEEKIVVAPEVDIWRKDFYPDDWKVLSADLG